MSIRFAMALTFLTVAPMVGMEDESTGEGDSKFVKKVEKLKKLHGIFEGSLNEISSQNASNLLNQYFLPSNTQKRNQIREIVSAFDNSNYKKKDTLTFNNEKIEEIQEEQSKKSNNSLKELMDHSAKIGARYDCMKSHLEKPGTLENFFNKTGIVSATVALASIATPLIFGANMQEKQCRAGLKIGIWSMLGCSMSGIGALVAGNDRINQLGEIKNVRSLHKDIFENSFSQEINSLAKNKVKWEGNFKLINETLKLLDGQKKDNNS